MRIPYYPGCTLKNTAKNFEISSIETAKVLGIEFEELPRWNCCGSVYGMARDNIMHQVGPVRNLLRVREMGGQEVVTLCSMCYNTLKRANNFVKKNRDKLEVVNAIMYLENTTYDGSIEVLHYLEILRDRIGFDEIEKHVKKPLKGLRVGAYYGCLLVRPLDAALDDPEEPGVMEKLFEVLGAEVVDFPLKTECCGSYQTVSEKDIVTERTRKIIDTAHDVGIDVIALSCPLCHFNLDRRQKNVLEKYIDFKTMPVLYFSQLMALAFDLPLNVNLFEKHYVDPLPVLKARGIIE